MTDQLVMEFNPQDLARLQRALDNLKATNLMKGQWSAIGMDVINEVSPYPGETWRNRDTGRGFWYERGYGYRGSKDVGRTSAPLGKSWHQTAYPDYVKVYNTATYASDVQGETQMFLHALNGWKRLRPTAEAMIPKIIRKIEAYALKIWNRTT